MPVSGYIASEIDLKSGDSIFIYSFIGSHATAAPILTPTCIITRVILLIQLDWLFQSLFHFNLLHDVHLCDESLEALLDVCVGEGGALTHIDKRLAHDILLDLLRADLTRLMQVALVRHEADLHLLVWIVAQLLQPIVEIVEGIAFRDIKHKQGTDSLAIVPSRDASVALTAGRVPDLGLYQRVVR